MIDEALYLDLDGLKWSESGGGGGGGMTEREESPAPFIKSLLCASVLPVTKSHFWPSMPSREQQGYQKLILVKTIIMLIAEVRHIFHCLSSLIISGHQHIMARGYHPNTDVRKPLSRWQTPSAWENTLRPHD